MTREQAYKILGRNRRYFPGIARALSFFPWENDENDWRRIEALATLGYKRAKATLEWRKTHGKAV